MVTSILESVKQMCSVYPEDDNFDSELIIYTNSALAVLIQLGVGSRKTFSISSSAEKWTDFLDVTDSNFELIKTCTFLKVRLMFDPPQNSFLVNSIQEQIKELEFRIELNASASSDEE